MTQCVFCNSGTDLNTEMTVTLEDGTKHTVKICDEHAEEATVKSVKAAFAAKQEQIEAVLAQAKALGLNISETSGGLVVAQQQEPPKPPPVPESPSSATPPPRPKPKKELPALEAQEGEIVVPTSKVDTARGIRSVGGNAGGHSVQSHSSYQEGGGVMPVIPEEVKEGEAVMGVVEGREGQPLAIPKKRRDGLGTTRITINKGKGDAALQERFKRMAQDSINDNQAPDFRNGYEDTTSTCQLCRGNGEIRHTDGMMECPKCSGSGMISRY